MIEISNDLVVLVKEIVLYLDSTSEVYVREARETRVLWVAKYMMVLSIMQICAMHSEIKSLTGWLEHGTQ